MTLNFINAMVLSLFCVSAAIGDSLLDELLGDAFCATAAAGTDDAPAFPDGSYSIVLQQLDADNRLAASIRSQFIDDNKRSVSSVGAGESTKKQQWIFDKTAARVIEDDYSCSFVAEWAKYNGTQTPLLIDAAVFENFTNDAVWRDFQDFATFVKLNTAKGHLNATEDGRQTWLGCLPNAAKNAWLQITIVFEKAGNVAEDALLSLQLDAYDATTQFYSTRYQLSRPTAANPECPDLSVPAGIYCEGAPEVTLPTFGTALQTDATYFDSTNVVQKFDVAAAVFDGNGYFTYDRVAQKDAPFFDQKMSESDARVVHDFKYGVEYGIKSSTGVCEVFPRAIPDSAADVNNGTSMRSVAQLLLGDMPAPVVKSQQRWQGGQLYDVYVARRDAETTVELSVGADKSVNDGQLGEQAKPPTAFALTTYHWDTAKRSLASRSTLYYNVPTDQSELSSPVVDWSWFDVTPCLGKMAFYSVNLEGRWCNGKTGITKVIEASMEQLQKEGLKTAVMSLLQQLATTANVSVLRLSAQNAYFLEEQSNAMSFFFTLAERATEDDFPGFAPQLDRAAAVDNLNSTITAGALPVKDLKIMQDSFILVSDSGSGPLPPPPPAPVPQGGGGASGGAMFVLAVCMLVIGALMGVAGAWWMWKRNRGIAYQVYE